MNDNSDAEEVYSSQINYVSTLFGHYKDMQVLKSFMKDDAMKGVLAIVRYALKFFNMSNVEPLEFWSRILSLQDEYPHWRPAVLLVEICLCAP